LCCGGALGWGKSFLVVGEGWVVEEERSWMNDNIFGGVNSGIRKVGGEEPSDRNTESRSKCGKRGKRLLGGCGERAHRNGR